MSNYSKTTDFEAKDSLPTGDSGKIIRGSEFETEFDAISAAIATKADTAGPTFTGTLTFETISDGTINVTAFVDEDNMASNSATLIPTQQSVKAYVDSQLTAQDLDFQADSGGALSIDLDSETMTFTGGTGIDTSGSGNAVTFAIDSTVATLTGSQTLTNKTLTSPDVNTPDIDGGTIDNTVIGGSTAAAGSFTSLSANSISNLIFVDSANNHVGINTNSPASLLHVYHATDDTILKIESGDGQSRIDLIDSGGAARLNSVGSDLRLEADPTNSVNNSTIDFKVDGTQVMRINDSFNVGIGTTFPSAKLDVAGTIEFDGLSGTGSVTVTDILDQDDMSSNSATALATQQSIKAYVDSQVATADTLSEVLANGNTTGGTNIVFGDSSGASDDRLVFGAGSDLQIYHDGSDSYIQDSGAGDLRLKSNGSGVKIEDAGNTLAFFDTVTNNAKLYHNSNQKLETTGTGIDVTGTAVTDGLTVESTGATFFNATVDAGTGLTTLKSTNNSTGGSLKIQTGGNDRFQISAGGNISFFEDTGTTAKFFFDASAESLGIGTSSPANLLDIVSTSNATARIEGGANGDASLKLTESGNSGVQLKYDGTNNLFAIGGGTSGSFTTHIAVTRDSGSVGIGTDSPGANLQIHDTNSAKLWITADGSNPTNAGSLRFAETQAGGNYFEFLHNGSANTLTLTSTNGEIATFDRANQRVGIGTNNPQTLLHLQSTSPVLRLTDSDTGADSLISASSSAGALSLSADNNNEVANSFMNFKVDGSEAMRLDSSGHLIVPNGVTLGTSVGTYAAANTLDDYEEGTWTPTIEGVTSGSITGFTVTVADYTKIGDVVHAYCFLTGIDMTSSTISGNYKIGGLPITASSHRQLVVVSFCNMFNFDEEQLSVSGYAAANTIILRKGSSHNAISNGDEGTTQTNASIMIGITYHTNA